MRRRWREYRTEMGNRPVKAFIAELEPEEMAEIAAEMSEVAKEGLSAARHLRGEISARFIQLAEERLADWRARGAARKDDASKP